jgi:uncharacterized protein
MQTFRTPGVHLHHILTEPARVLQTGVPVFLGLVRQKDLDALNLQKAPTEERYLPPQPLRRDGREGLVRKQGYLKLPGRTFDPSADVQISDRAARDPRQYLRTVVPANLTDRTSPAYARQVRSTGGAGGAPAPGAEAPAHFNPVPQRFTVWPQFEQTYGDLAPYGFLTYAVRGFFENGGSLCYAQVVSYPDESGATAAALAAGLASLEPYDDFDLVCVPDLAYLPGRAWDDPAYGDVDRLSDLQRILLEHCARQGDRMAILDSAPGASPGQVQDQRHWLSGENGALYYPWVRIPRGPEFSEGLVPPCGHVAGVYARCDKRVGVHKAPANEVLEGVIDLETCLTDAEQAELNVDPTDSNRGNINCLRAFARRGIRVWGARTLSTRQEWTYVNVRRVMLTVARWIDRNMRDYVFEPHTPGLWDQIARDLTEYLTDLARQGALYAPLSGEAFYVKCDAETNPVEIRDAGMVIAEIGFQPPPPTEFIIVRIIHGPTGTQIIGPEVQPVGTTS